MRLVLLYGLLAAAGVLLTGGCRGDDTNTEHSAFAVVVSAEAASASSAAGVDLEELVSQSAEAVFDSLSHRGRVKIRVRVDPSAAIPEIGVGGITDAAGNVNVFLNTSPPQGFREALETWIPATVAHELHHSSRVRIGPGYGESLGEALVTEGLADRFMEEVFPATPPAPWDHAISEERVSALWRRAQPDLWIPWALGGYDHRAWFIGGDDLPRWGGYTLGYRLTGAYLRAGHKPSDSVRTTAEKVVDAYVAESS